MVHLLLVLPVAAANRALSRLDELDVVRPDATRLLVYADIAENKVIRLHDDLTCVAGGFVQVVASADVVKVLGPKLHVERRNEMLGKDCLGG